mgnify:CR=1 FL=1
MVQIKRAYSQPIPNDGVRILVDRVWPRGCTKEHLQLDAWRKDLAPSTALRKWFGHDPRKWVEFKQCAKRCGPRDSCLPCVPIRRTSAPMRAALTA